MTPGCLAPPQVSPPVCEPPFPPMQRRDDQLALPAMQGCFCTLRVSGLPAQLPYFLSAISTQSILSSCPQLPMHPASHQPLSGISVTGQGWPNHMLRLHWDVHTPTEESLSGWLTHSLGLRKAGGLTLDHSMDLPPFLISLFCLSSHG